LSSRSDSRVARQHGHKRPHLLPEHAPTCIKEHDIKTLFGRELLTNDAGETTSHLMGFFYRTIRIVENGIKPAYVFDGKPPELKKGVVSLSVLLGAEANANVVFRVL
jgi:hypothetical protein